MKDFNFFEPYLDKREISGPNVLIFYAVALVVVLGLIIYPLINVFKINSLKKSVTAMKTSLESSTIYERLDIVEQKKEKVSEMEEKSLLLNDADKIIESRDVVNDLLLNRITEKIPKEVFLKSLNLSADLIQMQGMATGNLAVACLETNLKSDKGFKNIYISNISLKDGLYDFSISFALEDTEESNVEQDDIEQDDAEENGAEQKDVKQDETK
ncbi:MAG TPA: PilN domain-containing protein [Clostridia bacterium]|nr:PilN domain-containing protein [Clostridia bacterium]